MAAGRLPAPGSCGRLSPPSGLAARPAPAADARGFRSRGARPEACRWWGRAAAAMLAAWPGGSAGRSTGEKKNEIKRAILPVELYPKRNKLSQEKA